MRGLAILAAGAALTATAAPAAEPAPISTAKQVKPGHGALRISVQSQTQQQGTLHLWFVRVEGDPARSQDVLEFERKVGVPLVGSNMIDSKPLVYSVRPGRYRLIGHGVKCGALPPPGTSGCSVSGAGH